MSAVTALMNTSGTAIVTGADTVRVGQGVVENILTSVSGLVSGATASNLTAGSVANLAALTATSVATSSSISNAGANAAVLLCMTVAASPASTVGVASNVVFSISGLSSANVSTSTRNGTAAAANASMPFVTTLAPVLNAVSSSLLRLLTSGSTNSSSIRISSPNMNITVAAVPVNATNGTALAVGNAVVPAAALASVPTVGRSLLGDAEYDRLRRDLKPGQQAILVAGDGPYSFRGSGYVRGGIFDRIEVIQSESSIRFRDRNYRRLGAVAAEGAPDFPEIGIFVTPDGSNLDPGVPWRFQLLVQRATGLLDPRPVPRRTCFAADIGRAAGGGRADFTCRATDGDHRR